jgi:hypothetical protein
LKRTRFEKEEDDKIGKPLESWYRLLESTLELEEKERLFQNKVDELKTIFEKQNLDNLKGLSFELKPEPKKITLEDGEESVKGTGKTK